MPCVMVFENGALGKQLGLDEVMKVWSRWWNYWIYKKMGRAFSLSLQPERTQWKGCHLQSRKRVPTTEPDFNLGAKACFFRPTQPHPSFITCRLLENRFKAKESLVQIKLYSLLDLVYSSIKVPAGYSITFLHIKFSLLCPGPCFIFVSFFFWAPGMKPGIKQTFIICWWVDKELNEKFEITGMQRDTVIENVGLGNTDSNSSCYTTTSLKFISLICKIRLVNSVSLSEDKTMILIIAKSSIMSSIKDVALMATSSTINVIWRHFSSLFALFPSGKMGIVRFSIESC